MEALARTTPGALEIPSASWTRERIDLIKKTVCPQGITDDEFALFIEQCKRSGLDPLIKEAFCVPRRMNIGNKDNPRWITKHEFQPSEAGMLSRAERFGDCRGVSAAAVHEGDACEVDAGAGLVVHKFNPAKKRGPLLGAWARLQREGKTDAVVWLDLGGYQQNTPLWGKIPATMIEKCARAAVLRKAYPSAFGGLYIREEMPAEEFEIPTSRVQVVQPQSLPANTATSTTEAVKAKLRSKAAIIDVAPGQTEAEAEAAQDEAPSEPTPYERCRDAAKARGLTDGKRFSALIRGATGGRTWKEVVEADVPAIMTAIELATQPHPVDADQAATTL